MFDPKSDCTLNKMAPNAIVYKDAAGEVPRLTQADFLSLEEFQRWKAWSDENYHTASQGLGGNPGAHVSDGVLEL